METVDKICFQPAQMHNRITSFIVAVALACACVLAACAVAAVSTERAYATGTATDIVNVALGEQTGEYDSSYNKYNTSHGHGGLGWCSCFTRWCAREAGVSEEAYPESCLISYLLSYYQGRGEYYSCWDWSYTPKKGDLIFYGYSEDDPTHIGIITSVDVNAGKIYTREGNTGNSEVRDLVRPLHNDNSSSGYSPILGYASPAYAPDYERADVSNRVTFNSGDLAVTLESSLDDNIVVDVSGGSTSNGANVQIYGDNRSAAQRYTLVEEGNSYYSLINVNSGKALDVACASNDIGANVWQYDYNGSDAQLWAFVPSSTVSGAYTIVSKCNGMCLDIYCGQASNGNNLQMWADNDSMAQQFYVDFKAPAVAEGIYVAFSSVNSLYALDVWSASEDDGANVQLWESNGTCAQQFELDYDSTTGYYTLANVNSGKVLDVMYGDTTWGANVWQYSSNGSAAQQWDLEEVENDDGTTGYLFYTALGSGCVLDVSCGVAACGQNVQLWGPNGTAAQSWQLVATK